MLLHQRFCDVPQLGVHLRCHHIISSRLRVSIWGQKGALIDNRLLPYAYDEKPIARWFEESPPRSVVFIELEGRTEMHWRGKRGVELGPGGGIVQRKDHGGPPRQQGLQLGIEWESGSIGGCVQSISDLRFTGRDLARLAQAASVIQGESRVGPRVVQAVRKILDVLRSCGLPLEKFEAEELVEPIDPGMEAVNTALGKVLTTRLSVGPTIQDMEAMTGMSRRHLQRTFSRYLRYGHFPWSIGWRDFLRHWRLSTGTALMSTERATTEGVARILGYSSPEALCRAFADAGLPSPGNIRAALRAL